MLQIIHHCKIEDVEKLESIFAYLTTEGWKIPQWLVTLRLYAK